MPFSTPTFPTKTFPTKTSPSRNLPSTVLRLAAAVALATSVATATASPADAAVAAQCRMVQSQTAGGFAWRVMPTGRVCSASLGYGTSGVAHLAQRSITINYSARNTSVHEVEKATVHELAHHVEYRTTAAHRARLYAYLGIKDPSGNYFIFNDAYYYSGPLSRWKASPRERLAESVVNCRYGTPNHTGMALVPRSRCTAFLGEFRASLAAAR